MRTTLQSLFLYLALAGLPILIDAQPANDNCADAISIGEVGIYYFDNMMATTDGSNHPNDCASSGASPDSIFNDIWFLYTASFTGYAKWSTCGSANFDTKIVVYNPGSTCVPGDGQVLTCSEDHAGCSGATSEVVFPVTMNESYLLRLGAWGDGPPGEEGEGTFFILETIPPPPGPDNDDCLDAIEVFLGEGQPFESTNANTDGPGHPSASCFAFGNDFVNADIWYYFTSPITGTVEWFTCDFINWDTRLAVYQAGATCPLSDGDLLACNDDGAGCADFTSYLTFPATMGETYMLRLGGYTTSDYGTGSFSLNDIIPPPPPANNNCLEYTDSAFVVSPANADIGDGVAPGTTLHATQDADVPPCITNGELYDVWFKFNNEGITDLEVRFLVETEGSGFIFEIYEDCQTPALDTANGGILSNTCFSVVAGEVYIVDTITGFPELPTDYYIRVSTNITYDPPGAFWFQLVSDQVVSNRDPFLLEKASIFPNPVRGIATVEMDLKEPAQTTFEVFNGLGQQVYFDDKGNLMEGNYKFDLNTSTFGTGIYFLKIKAGEKQKILKFIKN